MATIFTISIVVAVVGFVASWLVLAIKAGF